ncbi:MAG TPA: hypothetical protein PLX06_04305, partial [Fimbriimonadaceae bacterium]|nr:hypothetical protein [Fimbriimonadaceae bacterium]
VRLRAVAKGIQHYVGRVPAEPSDAIKRDPFAIRSRSRVVRYLEMLAEDIENLATHCQAVAKKTVSTVTVARVAATS